MQIVKQGDLEIGLTKTFAAPIDVVFRALTEPQHVMQWMKTEHMRLVSCEIDLRVGGRLRNAYETPSGRKLAVLGVFEHVDAPRGFTYLESYDFSPLTIRVTTTLEATGPSTTFKQTLAYGTQEERDADFENIATSSPIAHALLDRHLTSLLERH